MFKLPSMLRYLLVLAFCLDGSAGLWKASAMATSAVQHLHAGDHEAGDPHHGATETIATTVTTASAPDCPDVETPGQGDDGHEGCDCTDAGCSCTCDLLKVSVAHKVPPAGTAWLAYIPVLPDPTTVGKSSLSSVFRPPIG
ncbi:CopL family metal-binding regulatory protein [Luteimonas soli]|uniref:CopL family metal-binding regulatory protein n=1 Tax=Luteimonas soli TaxID=1648966 RepID=A0ABV7XIN0_9GAMM